MIHTSTREVHLVFCLLLFFLMTQCDCDGMDKPRLNAHLTMPEEALPIVVSLGLMNFW